MLVIAQDVVDVGLVTALGELAELHEEVEDRVLARVVAGQRTNRSRMPDAVVSDESHHSFDVRAVERRIALAGKLDVALHNRRAHICPSTCEPARWRRLSGRPAGGYILPPIRGRGRLKVEGLRDQLAVIGGVAERDLR